jgi:hypothetical protein
MHTNSARTLAVAMPLASPIGRRYRQHHRGSRRICLVVFAPPSWERSSDMIDPPRFPRHQKFARECGRRVHRWDENEGHSTRHSTRQRCGSARSGTVCFGRVGKDHDLTETALREWIKRAAIDAGKAPLDALTMAERAEIAEPRSREGATRSACSRLRAREARAQDARSRGERKALKSLVLQHGIGARSGCSMSRAELLR